MADDYKTLQPIPGEPLHVTAERFYRSPEVLHLSEFAQIGSPSAAVKRIHAIVGHMVSALSALSQRPLTSCLDVGCNGGALTRQLALHFPQTVGIDHSPYLIESAAARYPSISFRVADARQIDIPSACYDVVVCSALIHYLPDWREILTECSRVLRPDGFLLLQFTRAIHPAHSLARAFVASLVGRRRWKKTYTHSMLYIQREKWRLRFRRDHDPIELRAVIDFLPTIRMQAIQLHIPRRFPGLKEDQVGLIAQHCHAESPREPVLCTHCLD